MARLIVHGTNKNRQSCTTPGRLSDTSRVWYISACSCRALWNQPPGIHTVLHPVLQTPSSWERHCDESTGRPYYHDRPTGTTTWHEPPQLLALRQQQAALGAAKEAGAGAEEETEEEEGVAVEEVIAKMRAARAAAARVGPRPLHPALRRARLKIKAAEAAKAAAKSAAARVRLGFPSRSRLDC